MVDADADLKENSQEIVTDSPLKETNGFGSNGTANHDSDDSTKDDPDEEKENIKVKVADVEPSRIEEATISECPSSDKFEEGTNGEIHCEEATISECPSTDKLEEGTNGEIHSEEATSSECPSTDKLDNTNGEADGEEVQGDALEVHGEFEEAQIETEAPYAETEVDIEGPYIEEQINTEVTDARTEVVEQQSLETSEPPINEGEPFFEMISHESEEDGTKVDEVQGDDEFINVDMVKNDEQVKEEAEKGFQVEEKEGNHLETESPKIEITEVTDTEEDHACDIERSETNFCLDVEADRLKIHVGFSTPGPSASKKLDTPYPHHRICARRPLRGGDAATDVSFTIKSESSSPAVMNFNRLRKYDGEDALNLAVVESRKRRLNDDEILSPEAKRPKQNWLDWVNPMKWLRYNTETKLANEASMSALLAIEPSVEAVEDLSERKSCVIM